MPAYAVDLLAQAYGDLAGRSAWRCSVRPTEVGSRRRPSPVCSRRSRRWWHGGRLRSCTTRSTATRSSTRSGFPPYHLGEPVDAAIIQADHADYRTLDPDDLPGIHALVDGRAITDPDRWTAAGVVHRTLGVGPPVRHGDDR